MSLTSLYPQEKWSSSWTAMTIPSFPHGKHNQPKLVQTWLSFIDAIARVFHPGDVLQCTGIFVLRGLIEILTRQWQQRGQQPAQSPETGLWKLGQPHNVSKSFFRTVVSPWPTSLLIYHDLLSPEEQPATWSLLAVSRAYYCMHIRNSLISSKKKKKDLGLMWYGFIFRHHFPSRSPCL